MSDQYRVEVFEGEGDQPWRARIRHRNGNIIWSISEGYSTKRSLMKSLKNFCEATSLPIPDGDDDHA